MVERAGLVLAHGDTGLCVRATEHIGAGACIAPYYGVLTTFDFDSSDQASEYAHSTTERFKGRNVYIDSDQAGNVARLITTRAM